MSAGASGGAAAAGAAAAHRRKLQEELEMTNYSGQDLAEGWEFKILRSMTGAFRNPERLRQILAEEKRAGWIFVEKFDDGRIRLKRPATAQEFDGKLEFDAYRTYIGPSENQFGLTIVCVAIGSALALIGLIVLIARLK